MKVIVFGATGTIGKELVKQSLEAGYEVTAFSRSATALTTQHPSLIKANGDVMEFTDVSNALKGHDAVLVVLGSGSKRTGNVRSVGTRNIINAMKANNVNRLICQTTLGCGDSKGNLNFFWKRIMFGWFLKEVFLDHEVQEDMVRNSGLDWTIVRPAAFTNGARTNQYKHGFSANEKSLTLKISRADIAAFILDELKTLRYLKKSPGLSY